MPRVREIPLDQLTLPEREARAVVSEEGLEELADSIRRLGVMNPITVRPKGDKFEIVAGVRRYLAAQRAGLEKVPCIVKDFNELDFTIAQIHENIKREELSEIDQGILIRQLREEGGLTYAQIAEMWGKSETHVRNLDKLPDCDQEIQEALRAGHIKYTHALEIMRHPDRERRLWFLKYTIENGASPQTLRVMIRDDMGMHEMIKEVVPVQKLTDSRPHLREIRGRCAFCDRMVIVDQLMVIHLCFDCYNAFMESRRRGEWQSILRGTEES